VYCFPSSSPDESLLIGTKEAMREQEERTGRPGKREERREPEAKKAKEAEAGEGTKRARKPDRAKSTRIILRPINALFVGSPSGLWL